MRPRTWPHPLDVARTAPQAPAEAAARPEVSRAGAGAPGPGAGRGRGRVGTPARAPREAASPQSRPAPMRSLGRAGRAAAAALGGLARTPAQPWSPPAPRAENTSPRTMNLNLQCQQLSDARWTELLPLIQQYEVVRLDDCGLTEVRCRDIHSALQANPSLTELSLCTNELGDAGVQLVLQGLRSPSCKIQKLSLRNCCLTHAGCGVLPDMLRSLVTLRELQLSDNPLGDAGLRLLCQGLLDPQCHLEKLQLEYCNLTAASCEPLAEALRAGPHFRELTVSNNEIGEAGVRALCRGLVGSACPLETLRLENCGLTSASCEDLHAVVASKASLQELDLGDNRLGDQGIATLCPALVQPSSRLRVLWLWECDITAAGCRELCRVLRAKESLKELSLAGNALGDEGARLLCESLVDPRCRLQSLWVKSCSLTATCCPHVGTMLTQNKHLEELQMSDNKLGDAGVRELCRGLSQPGAALRVLWLGDCDVANGGCGSLASLLVANRSLRELDLSNNCMDDQGILRLVESLDQPDCALEQLVLYDIYWTQQTEDLLHALEERKPGLRIIS